MTDTFTHLFDEIGKDAALREREGIAPHDEIERLRAARFGAVRLPRSLGGAGASLRDFFALLVALSRADPDVAHILRAHFVFVERRLVETGLDPGDRWLAETARGAIFGNAGAELSSNASGSKRFTTTLTRDDGAWVLDGVKYYSTGSLYSDHVVVMAQRDDGSTANVVVPAGREGMALEDDWDGIGQRASASGTTTLRRVRVHDEEIVDVIAADPSAPATYRGTFSQLYLTAVIAGILQRIRDDAAEHLRGRRRSFTHAPAPEPRHDPLLQQVVGELASAAAAAEAIVDLAARAQDVAFEAELAGATDGVAAQASALRSAEAKVVVDALAQRAASALFDVGGGSAVTRGVGLDRHWRNIRTLASHNPTPYKAQSVGAYYVNGTPPPDNGYF